MLPKRSHYAYTQRCAKCLKLRIGFEKYQNHFSISRKGPNSKVYLWNWISVLDNYLAGRHKSVCFEKLNRN